MAKLALPRIKLDQEPTIRERIFYVAALAGIAILFANTFWTPTTQDIARMQAERASLMQQSEAFQRLIDATRSQLQRASAETKRTPEVSEKVQRILERRITDPTDEINATVDQLGSRKVSRRIKVKKIELGARSDMPGYAVAPITIELVGPYTAVQGYLEAIEEMDRALAVRQIDINRGPDNPQELSTTLAVDLYVPKP